MRKLALVLLVFAFQFGFAQKTILELAEDKKLEKFISLDAPGGKPAKDGIGAKADLTKTSLTKIALVSFYLNDQGDDNAYRTMGIGEDGGNYYATKFYSQSIDPIKTAFSKEGMQILTPSEFLDSEEKRQAYENFEMEVGRMARMVLGFVNSISDAATDAGFQVSATPAGYELIPAAMAAGDYKLNESMGKLTEDLGVDAVMVAFVDTKTDDRSSVYMKSGMALYGPNPIPKEEGKRYPGMSYNSGMYYGKTEVTPKNAIEFAEIKRKEITEESYDGFGYIMGEAASQLAAYIQTEKSGG